MMETPGRKCNAWRRPDDGERHGAVNCRSIVVTRGRNRVSLDAAVEEASGGARSYREGGRVARVIRRGSAVWQLNVPLHHSRRTYADRGPDR
jgi:hypothetical protein